MGAEVVKTPSGNVMSKIDDGQIKAFLKDILDDFGPEIQQFARDEIDSCPSKDLNLEKLYWRCRQRHRKKDYQRFFKMADVSSNSQVDLVDLD